MFTTEDHLKAGQQTVDGLKAIKSRELLKAGECWFYQMSKKAKHLKKAAQMDEYINKMGEKPTSIRAALIIPDHVLAEMGWE